MSEWRAPRIEISEALASRLDELAPGQMIRLIVLSSVTAGTDQPNGRASRRASRDATIEAARAAVQPGLAEIDRILARCGGRHLNGNLSSLGAVAVETTAEGARALAESEHVRVLLEDQPMHGILATRT